MMKNQKGAALIVVLSLLTISLMVGLSSMQSSQIDERLAGNYKAATEAQMNAETVASELLVELKESDQGGYKFKGVSSEELEGEILNWSAFSDFNNNNSSSCMEKTGLGAACWVNVNGPVDSGIFYLGHNIVAFGINGVNAGSESLPLAVDLKVNPGSSSIVNDVLLNISGGLINVIDEYGFSSSSNDDAKEWEDKINVNSEMFSSPEEVRDFRDALYSLSQSDQGGSVNFFNANDVKKQDITSSSDGIVVIEGDGLSVPNNSEFTGVMVVFGNQFRITGGGNTKFSGVILHVPYSCSENACSLVQPLIDIRGGQGNYNQGVVSSISESVTSGSDSDAEVIGVSAWR